MLIDPPIATGQYLLCCTRGRRVGDAADESAGIYTQYGRKRQDVEQTDITLTPLDGSDVCAVEAGLVGQLLLRQADCGSCPPKPEAELGERSATVIHALQRRMLMTKGLQTISSILLKMIL